MRGIVYTGDDVEVTDQLSVGDPGPTEVRVAIGAAGVCHSDLSVSTAPSPGRHPRCWVTRAPAWSKRWAPRSHGQGGGPRGHRHPPELRQMPGLQYRSSDLVREDVGQRVPALHVQRRAGLQFRRHLGVRRVDHHQGSPGGQDLQRRTHDVGLPHRLRGPDRGRGRVQPGQGPSGETSAVFGVGGVGLNVIQGLRLAGASRIIAVDTMASKENWPASSAPPISSMPRPPMRWPPFERSFRPARRVTGALGWTGGVNWAFDCVGHPAVLRNALDVLDWGGNAIALGIPPQGTEVSVDVNALGLCGPRSARLSLRLLASPSRHSPDG